MAKTVKTILGNSNGTKGVIVDVECHLSNNLPNIVIVGFATKAVDEAKERIRGALATSNIRLPKKRITINLAPADIPKEGSSFDLAIALAIMQAGELVGGDTGDHIVIGELGLDGSIRPVRGIIGKILAAKQIGVSSFIIPDANNRQAQLVPGVKLLPVKNLQQIYSYLNKAELPFLEDNPEFILEDKNTKDNEMICFEDVVGQTRAKRALLIAAAGHHNIMLNGPPGTGKSMLAKALTTIMPPLTSQEMLEVTHIHSLANKDFDQIITQRPVRNPHHSSSQISIIGGGQNPRPGEISLSHNGILFFDEFPEFSRSILEALRQPLEDRKITVSRVKDSFDFPAHFILVATANPCPCGYYNSRRECSCTANDILKYQKRISGPVFDRIDLYVDIDEVENNKLLSSRPANDSSKSKSLQSLVIAARKRQKKARAKLNSQLSNKELKEKSRLSKDSEGFLNNAANQLNLSARGYMRTLRVANTIADLNNSSTIGIAEISEALQYRKRSVEL